MTRKNPGPQPSVNLNAFNSCVSEREKLTDFFNAKKDLSVQRDQVKKGQRKYVSVDLIVLHDELDAATWKQRCGSLSQVCDMVGVKRPTLQRWVEQDKVRSYRGNDRVTHFVCVDDVIELIKHYAK